MEFDYTLYIGEHFLDNVVRKLAPSITDKREKIIFYANMLKKENPKLIDFIIESHIAHNEQFILSIYCDQRELNRMKLLYGNTKFNVTVGNISIDDDNCLVHWTPFSSI